MHPKKIWANVAVSDLVRTTRFYTALGFEPNTEHISKELTSFFFGDDKFVIHFFLKEVLSKNIKSELAETEKVQEVIYTLSAESRHEVDRWANEVEKAGGKLVSQPEEFGKGYYGFLFADPDGHRFNVFFM